MKKAVVLIAAILAMASHTFADTDFFGGFVKVNGTWFQLQNPGAIQVTNFDGFDFGTVATLTLDDAAGLTYKNGSSDVTGVLIGIIIDGVSQGEFAHPFGADIPFSDPVGNTYNTTPGDQRWGGNGTGTVAGTPYNVLAGLLPGQHTLEVYLHATTNEGDRYLNDAANNFDNYKAKFTVIPEPTTMVLVGMGLAGAMMLRRRTA